ncbi:helix-turn-helix transcriptional regulator [Streptomyces sp. NBC_00464]|uniref:helix-turn-helix domain-containing protein n=1 Tax=Streptomyces sp. NBC_00464 TaxID=2975751 RepID=UPI002E1855C5
MTTGRIEVGPTGRTVAANVKRLRESQGLTLRGLSAALKERGRPLSADAVNKIENGAAAPERGVRRVDVDDLMALAVVLDVPVITLLLPESVRGPVELTGEGEVNGTLAWRWAQGRVPLKYPEGADEGTRRKLLAMYLMKATPDGVGWDQTTQEGQRAALEVFKAWSDEGGTDGQSVD